MAAAKALAGEEENQAGLYVSKYLVRGNVKKKTAAAACHISAAHGMCRKHRRKQRWALEEMTAQKSAERRHQRLFSVHRQQLILISRARRENYRRCLLLP